MAIIHADLYKAMNLITASTFDIQLGLLCDQADSAIKRWLGIDIESTSYPGAATNGRGDSGYYQGAGSRYLVLRHWPVTTLTSIYVDNSGYWNQNPDGSYASTALLTSGVDYAIKWDGYIGSASASYCAVVERLNGTWTGQNWYERGNITPRLTQAQGNIKVTYTAGWSTIPTDIVQAAGLLVSYYRSIQAKGMALTSESQGAYSYSVGMNATNGIPDTVVRLLAPYKRLVI